MILKRKVGHTGISQSRVTVQGKKRGKVVRKHCVSTTALECTGNGTQIWLMALHGLFLSEVFPSLEAQGLGGPVVLL